MSRSLLKCSSKYSIDSLYYRTLMQSNRQCSMNLIKRFFTLILFELHITYYIPRITSYAFVLRSSCSTAQSLYPDGSTSPRAEALLLPLDRLPVARAQRHVSRHGCLRLQRHKSQRTDGETGDIRRHIRREEEEEQSRGGCHRW